MKKDKKEKTNKNIDTGRIFVKLMAGFLAILMLVAACSTCIYALMNL